MKTHHKGFTVLEFLIVLAIIILLIAIVLPALGRSRERSLDEKHITDLKTVALGLEQYYQVCGEYPAQITPDINCTAMGANTLSGFIPNIESYNFATGASGYMYAPIAYDQNHPEVCNGFHVSVVLKNETLGTFATGDSDIDSGNFNICQADGVGSVPIDGREAHTFDIFK